ncbi:MAG: hypothetical protein ACTSX9_02635 [Candidatus Njordarchaeales archaeon]
MITRKFLAIKCPTCGGDIQTEIDLANAVEEPGGIYSVPIVHTSDKPHIVIVYLDKQGSIRGVESYDKIIAINIEKSEKMSMIIADKTQAVQKRVKGKTIVEIAPRLKDLKYLKKIKDPVAYRILSLCDGKRTLEDIRKLTGFPLDIIMIVLSSYVSKKWVEYKYVIAL